MTSSSSQPITAATRRRRARTTAASMCRCCVHGGKPGVDLGTRATLSDIGQTVAANFGVSIAKGESFLVKLESTH